MNLTKSIEDLIMQMRKLNKYVFRGQIDESNAESIKYMLTKYLDSLYSGGINPEDYGCAFDFYDKYLLVWLEVDDE